MIGRSSEAAAIARFAARVPSGPVGLLIEGEPGIGKTTVVSAAIRAAQERGHRVLQVQPAESEADLSFAALSDLVGGVYEQVRDLLPAPQRRAFDVALLLREADAPADPRTTASALQTVVMILSDVDPLVIVVDDAQWLDRASGRALEFLIRRLPERVGIVVARRPVTAGAGPLDLARTLPADRVERLVLGPLSLAALHHLARSRLGLRLSRPMLVRVAEASGGNPFYALEILDALARRPAPPSLGDVLPVPRTLHDLLNDRLDRLSPSGRAVASAASALSRPTAEILEAALGAEHDTSAALVETEAAGVLVPETDRLRFSHPLLASTIYGSLTSTRRRALHGRLAAVVDDPEERARHLARGVTAVDEGTARELEDAAGLAGRRGAPESAAELYQAACRLTPLDRPEDLARRMLGGADALTIAGDLEGARGLARQALETGPSRAIRARSLLLLGSLATYTDSLSERIAYQERALAEAGDDIDLRIMILMALFEHIGLDAEMAAARAAEAIRLLRERDDPSALAQSLMDKFIADAVLGRAPDAGSLDDALALEGRDGGRPLAYPLVWFHWIDDLDAARTRYRVQHERFLNHGDVMGAAEMVEFIAMTEFRAGNWHVAEQALEEACSTLGQLELRGPLTASFADRSIIDAHRGRFDRGRATLAGILDGVAGLDVIWRMVCHSALGILEFCYGDHEAADQAWTAMRGEARQMRWIDNLEDRSEPDHIESLIVLGRLDEARRLLEHLEWRGRTLPRPWIDAGLPRARALVLAADGRSTDALDVLGAAPRIRSLPFDDARLLLVKGQLERRANRKLAAKDSLTEALGIFEALGSPPWAQRARDEIARIGLRHRAPHQLTETERRIAELAATGMTNREVAAASFVSPKTVEANLARVYRKLGIRSRAELGARLSTTSGDAASRDTGTET